MKDSEIIENAIDELRDRAANREISSDLAVILMNALFVGYKNTMTCENSAESVQPNIAPIWPNTQPVNPFTPGSLTNPWYITCKFN